MTSSRTPLDEIDRLYQIADQDATSHSVLHNKYNWWHTAINTIAMVSAAFLLMATLASDETVKSTFHLSPDTYKWIMGAFAAANFSLTLVDLVWKPSEKSKAHQIALNHNTNTKYEIRKLKSESRDISNSDYARLTELHLSLKDAPKIPDKHFLGLKRHHKQKVRISKLLDKKSGIPVPIIRAILFFEDLFSDCGKKDSEPEAPKT